MVRTCIGAGTVAYISLISVLHSVHSKSLISLPTFELHDGDSLFGFGVCVAFLCTGPRA